MKREQETVSIREAWIESVIEVVPDACAVVDCSGHVIAANRAWSDLPRRSGAATAATNPVGLDYLTLFQSSTADEDLNRAVLGIDAILHGQANLFEHEYLWPSPPVFRWFRMTVRVLGHAGEVGGAIILHRDITLEKFGNLTSQEAEDRFRELANSAPVLIWMSGPDKGCTFFNRPWLAFTGVPMEDQLGSGWVRLVHRNDRDAILRAYDAAFDQGSEFECEYRLQHKEGGYRWIRDHGSPRFDSHQRLTGFIGSAWDLSDQKQAAETANRAVRYTQLMRDVAAIANSTTTMREALQQAIDVICETMGFPTGHALLVSDDEPELAKSAHVVHVKELERFKTLWEMSARMVWPAEHGSPQEMLREVLHTGKPAFHDHLENSKYPDRYPRAQACLEAGLRGTVLLPILVDDRVEAIIEFGTEESITNEQELKDTLVAATERLSRFFERRRAQIQLLKQKEELEMSAQRLFSVAERLVDSQEEERRRIAREIHDDFTQRLALVSVKIGSLVGREQSSTSAEINVDLEEIRSATSAVANDLRDLSHQLHPATLGLLGPVRALRTQCEEFQRTRGIETVFESSLCDQDTSQKAATCLYRVLQESLMNIARHSGSAIARVTLTREDNEIKMRICDQGRGFSQEAKGRTGIGLLNMDERVRLLNGTLAVYSEPGAGTEIVVRIPAVAPGQQETQRADPLSS